MVAVTLSKIVVVIINVIFLIFGLAALIVGIIFKVNWDEVKGAFIRAANEADFDLKTAGETLGLAAIIIGSFIVVVSLLGCIGAWCQVRVLLVLYAIIIIILIIAECVLVGVIASNATETENTIGDALEKNLHDGSGYYENSKDSKSKSFSALFNKLECCGIRNYNSSFPHNNTAYGFIPDVNRDVKNYPPIIPITCCKKFDYETNATKQAFKDNEKCLTNPTSDNAYTTGCLKKVTDIVTDNKGIVIGVGVTILVLELLMVIIAFFLCCREDKD